MKKYNYFYKITNNINGDFYYGFHTTNNLNDGYMGSGVALHEAYSKFGIENFTKEIIKYFNTRKEAYEYEAKMLTKEVVNNPHCLNLKTGGLNDFIYCEETIEKNRQSNIINALLMFGYTPGGAARKNKEPWNKGKTYSEETRKKISDAALKRECSGSKGYKWTEEQKQKLRKPKSEQAKQNMRKQHKNAKKHWKIIDGKRKYYN